MSKILNTQLIGIFNRLEKQSLEIQMAQCLIQAIGGEGYVYVKVMMIYSFSKVSFYIVMSV